MTNYTQDSDRPAKPKQLKLLRRLAVERGVTFVVPSTSREADRQIKALLRTKRSHAGERHQDLHAVSSGLSSGAGAAALIRQEEIGGYGSTAHWT